jgi:hypothetical protein
LHLETEEPFVFYPVVGRVDAIPQRGGIVGIRVDHRPEEIGAVDLGRDAAEPGAVDVGGGLVAGVGVPGRVGGDGAVGGVSGVDLRRVQALGLLLLDVGKCAAPLFTVHGLTPIGFA